VIRAAQRVSGDRRVQVGFVITAVVAAALAVVLDREAFLSAARQLGLGSLTVAFTLTLVNVLAAAAVWRSVLADLGSRLSVPAAFRIFLVGALGKYLPGSVWFLLAQTQLAAKVGVPAQRAASASIVTLVLTIATALLASLIVVPVAPSSVPSFFRWAPLLLPVIVAALYPPLLNRMLDSGLAMVRQPPLEHAVSALGVVRAVGWSLVSWLGIGGQVAVLATTVGAPLEWRTFVICLGGYCVAWAIGFLAVFTPAGAGAREAVLALVLASLLSPGEALVVVLVSRVLLTLADLSLAGLYGFAVPSRNGLETGVDGAAAAGDGRGHPDRQRLDPDHRGGDAPDPRQGR
jgi:hypothetical protein